MRRVSQEMLSGGRRSVAWPSPALAASSGHDDSPRT